MNPPRNAPSVEVAFQAASEEHVAELLAGRLYLSPRPALPHANVTSNLGALLVMPFKLGRGGPGGWVLLFEPELHLGPRPDKIVPDLAGWTRERLTHPVDGLEAPEHFTLAPDWVCEVHSERTWRMDQGQKMPLYAREGVQHLWLVDPLLRTLEVFRLTQGAWSRIGSFSGEARVRVPPFESLELELALVWAG